MDYIKNNKMAWEEAFENRHKNWGDENYLALNKVKWAFFSEDMQKEIKEIDLKGKKIAQFCCNNGREILSLVKNVSCVGVGFDIAENIINQAKTTANKAKIADCTFIACNILEIPSKYYNQFDFIFLTIGAITWFEDLNILFQKASKCLKTNGLLLINDFHPIYNMLALPGEESYNPNSLDKVAYSYFRKEPWIETNGMSYMSAKYESKPFTSFTHNMSNIINGLSANNLKTIKLNEYDYDISDSATVYNGKGFPLSYILIAEKC